MEKITKEYEIYHFDELSEDAQEKAISDHIDFEIEVYMDDEYSYIHDSVLEAERMQTPWFLGAIIYEDHKQDIIDNIEANEYLFFEDGELVPGSYYDQAI